MFMSEFDRQAFEVSEDEEDDEQELPERAKKVLTALTDHLHTLGLSRFSCTVAMGYMKSRLEQENGAEKFRHVMSYFLKELNASRSKKKEGRDVTTKKKAAEKTTGGKQNGRQGEDQEEDRCESEDEKIGDEEPSTLETIDWQRGCPNRFGTLTARPLWDKSSFPWLERLEENYGIILEEFNQLRNDGAAAFQPYRSPLSKDSVCDRDKLGQLATSKGNWNVSYLYLHGVDFQENVDRCPQTMRVIHDILPRHYHHAFFSALSPGTHISPHYGPTNKKLRIHLPLVVEGGAWLRVADRRVEVEQGKAIVFDDSFEHEAGNDHPATPRVVLVVDIWHPDLTDEEVKFLSFVNKGQINAAKKMKELVGGTEWGAQVEGDEDGRNEDFLSVIQNAREKSRAEAETGKYRSQIWKFDVRDD